ncbi:roadblock/LC7 domain-containing protein [Streptomyces sp. ACA25]|uniref:roadblock/LC7 domain-containing protein n=1 Tax=Streptomyces sp. ACA25 TaxID=3022596 RepID=UPI002307971C|nr:roadblock/LC7 domain-containing protein [Streptomyces sp. ACA25]MDB1086503.1 roadblock/LC7 domain-containing protein [Streptomyces sp. ACA25]
MSKLSESMKPHLDQVAERLLAEVPGVRHVLILTTDGLKAAVAGELGEDDQDRAAAMSAGLLSAARAATQALAGTEDLAISQVITETSSTDGGPRGWAIIMGTGHNIALAVWAGPDADIGIIAHRMTVHAGSLSGLLTAPARSDER